MPERTRQTRPNKEETEEGMAICIEPETQKLIMNSLGLNKQVKTLSGVKQIHLQKCLTLIK